MATSSDKPNPLRPYYVPPKVGLSRDPTAAFAGNKTGSTSHHSKSQSFGASARDLLTDLDYGEYIAEGSPSVAEVAKRLLDQAVWNYTTVLLAQPFEAAKTILQCYSPGQPHHNIKSPRTPNNGSSEWGRAESSEVSCMYTHRMITRD